MAFVYFICAYTLILLLSYRFSNDYNIVIAIYTWNDVYYREKAFVESNIMLINKGITLISNFTYNVETLV